MRLELRAFRAERDLAARAWSRRLRALGIVLLDDFEVAARVTVVVDGDVEDARRPVAARLRR